MRNIHNKNSHNSIHQHGNSVNDNHMVGESEDTDIDTSSQSQSHSHNHLENCFFALLQGLRHNTINLCVILVCSSYSIESLCHVDVAILDRWVKDAYIFDRFIILYRIQIFLDIYMFMFLYS